MALLTYLRNVSTLTLDKDSCTGCGICVTVCPHAVLEIREKKSRIRDLDACMECGACAQNCPENALKVKSGVGCAAAVINGYLGRTDAGCCCVEDQKKISCC